MSEPVVFRSVSIYYRDSDGVMRKIPYVKVTMKDDQLFQLYTLSPRAELLYIAKDVKE